MPTLLFIDTGSKLKDNTEIVLNVLLQDVTHGNYILIMVLIGLIKSKVGLKILGSTIYGTTEHLEKKTLIL